MAETVCDLHKERYDSEAGDCPLCVLQAELGEDQAENEQEEDAPAEPIVPLARHVEEDDPGAAEEAAARGQEKPRPDRGAAIDAFFRQLRAIKERDEFAILFFGFNRAGKTWLLHRMKEQLFNVDHINCEPRFEAVKAPPGERKGLPSTSEIEFHRVYEKPSFVLIDIPGEFTDYMLEWNFEELRMLLAAIDYVKAIIVAMPSDVLIFGEHFPHDDKAVFDAAKAKTAKKREKAELAEWAKGFRVDHDNITKFAEGVFHLAGLVSFVRHNRIDPSDEARFKQEVTAEAVIAHMGTRDVVPVGGPDGLDCPVFIALTKADRVLSLFFKSTDPTWVARDKEIRARADSRVFATLAVPVAKIRARLHDPWATIKLLRPALHHQLLAQFPLAKFDYVTAFYGHDGLPSLTREHYVRHPQRGVVEILEWIRDAGKLGARPKALRKHYAWAVRARHYVEGIRRPRRFDFSSARRP